MSSILTNLSVIQKLSKDLVQAKHLNYSQQCIPYYIDQTNFHVENLEDLKNPSGFLLKSTLIRHRVKQDHYKQSKKVGNKQFINYTSNLLTPHASFNTKCIVFLHGLGSSRLQALPIVQYLPKQYCLFAFDFAGSGKSQGQNITYGLRQSEDIGSILQYLKANKGIRQFIIWGRSMGAVAGLLYSINLAQSSKQSVSSQSQLNRVKGLVIDSPFSDFRSITKQIGLKRIKIPQFLLDFALNFIESSFNELLKDPKRQNKIYNPFQIKLGESDIQTKIPTIFVYSQNDQVVPKEHSQKIIKVYRSVFDTIVMEDCTHNQSRPKQSMMKIFQILGKFQSKFNSHPLPSQKQIKDGRASHLNRNRSFDVTQSRGGSRGRKGISVQSRQKQKQKNTLNIANINLMKTESNQQYIKNSKLSIESYSSLKIQPKRQKLSKNVYVNPTNAHVSLNLNSNKNASAKGSAYTYTHSNTQINNMYVYTETEPQQNQRTVVQIKQNNVSTDSPLKVRLSNSLNKYEHRNSIAGIGSGSGMKRTEKPKLVNMIGSINHFYNTIEYDNSILQRKLQKQKQVPLEQIVIAAKNVENKCNYKYRRNSQLNKKVQYQLSHTRYL